MLVGSEGSDSEQCYAFVHFTHQSVHTRLGLCEVFVADFHHLREFQFCKVVAEVLDFRFAGFELLILFFAVKEQLKSLMII